MKIAKHIMFYLFGLVLFAGIVYGMTIPGEIELKGIGWGELFKQIGIMAVIELAGACGVNYFGKEIEE